MIRQTYRLGIGSLVAGLLFAMCAKTSPAQAPPETEAPGKTTEAAAPAKATEAAPAKTTVAKPAPTADPKSEIELGPIIPPLNGAPESKGLRFNFRGVPLDTVLDYMSSAAGFAIIREAEISGNVDVVSHHPVSKEEAVMLLDTILHQKGLAALRGEKTLTIIKRDEARTRDLPVRMGSNPTSIPLNDEMVTQIMPVRHADVNQLMQNIDALLPDYSTISANQSSNAIIITDTQTNIRRVAKIIQALDTSISGVQTMRVIQLKHGRAADMANTINALFSGSATGGGGGSSDEERRRRIQEFFSRMRGGDGGRGGPPGGFGRR